MNFKKILFLPAAAVILIPLFCAQFQGKEVSSGKSGSSGDGYYGIWLLNREKTLEKMLEKKGSNLSSLPTEEQTHMIETFPFDIIVEFDRKGNWRGSFLDKDGTVNNGSGSFTVIKKEDHTFQIAVLEKSGEGSFADSFLIHITSEREIHLILGGEGTIDLILQRTKEFLPINERPKMVSPDSMDI